MKRTLQIFLTVLLALTIMAGCFLAGMYLDDVRMGSQVASAPVQAKVEEISALLDSYFIDDYDPEALTVAAGDGAAEAMVAATGDRWSYYVSAADMELHNELFYNSYVGIGVTIRPVDLGEEIVSVINGSPAQEAGLQVGDILVEAEGQSIAALGTEGTQDVVRGPEGTYVELKIRRDREEFVLQVERRAVITPVAEYEMLEDDIAYIRILNFDHHCAEQTLACLDQALADGAKGILFDVRFNGGGLKDEMVLILDRLLPEGEIFHSVDYAGHEEVDWSDAACLDLPMAVLVNEHSYSAAEFFAAALQEYGVGQVIGVPTSGKGNFQYTFDLSDGSAVAISSGHYVTPSGKSLSDVGISPDVVQDLNAEDFEALYYGLLEPADDDQLQAGLRVLSEKVS